MTEKSETISVREQWGRKEKYVKPLLKGLQYTFQHFMRKKITYQYPDERRPVSDNYRGLHRLIKDEQGQYKCVACGLCAAICPADAITLTPYEDEGGTRYPVEFYVDELRCIFCGFCEEICPRGAIELTKVYDYVDYTREDCIFDMKKLEDPEQFWFKEKKGRFQKLLG